ncbi:MAG: 1-deoxy-D-xylulose-5-phosphate synthase [candidate division WOR-3 bacterium]|nr:1-deoxy-D-xylulose-5-phosphate synthase [candidate division WOR-3 bacterium]
MMNITPQIIRTYNLSQLTQLCQKIREKIIHTTLIRGGHLAPSLGVVELTVALHYVFDTPNDKIIWDVGHQAYAHKLCTGRWEQFDSLRTFGGIAGFPRTSESEYDVFNSGHSGNSISVALGLATANRLQGKKQKVLAVIGDGSIVTGMAFEALNNAGASKEDLIVVLNDNEFSIGRTTGAMAKYLNRIITGRIYNRLKADTWNLLGLLPKGLSGKARIAARKLEGGLKNLIAPSIIFEELGFRYLGPFDGHNLPLLIEHFQKIKLMKGPLLVHIITKKGKGYEPAEKEPEKYHGIAPQSIVNTEERRTKNDRSETAEKKAGAMGITSSEVFGKTLCRLAKDNKKIIAISAGMCLGTGLSEFKKTFPDRFFDVGISEQHAVTFASGLALAGLRPVVAIYSTFLCRAYDQIIQDICLQNLPVIFAIDRAGLVGEDGETHHGMFDLSYLRTIPNLVVMAPSDTTELSLMLEFALNQNLPIAIRYPKNSVGQKILPNNRTPMELGRAEIIYMQKAKNEKRSPDWELRHAKCEIQREPGQIAIFAIGSMVVNAYQAIQMLDNENPQLVSKSNIVLVNMRFVKPLDQELIWKLCQESDAIITVEENTLNGGFGSAVLELIAAKPISANEKQKLCFMCGLPEKITDTRLQNEDKDNTADQTAETRKEKLCFMFGLPDKFITHGTREELLDLYGLSIVKLKEKFKAIIEQISV